MQFTRASDEQLDGAAELLSRAFHEDPGALLLYPMVRGRPAALKRGFARLLSTPGLCIVIGTVPGSREPMACAVWLPPGSRTMSLGGMVASMSSLLRHPRATLRMARAAPSLQRLQERCSPAEAWSLITLGVDPTVRGTGAGSALLQQGLREVVPSNRSCYLETLNPNNVRWFARAGFQVAGQIIPAGSTTTIAMVREP
ncbi:GNAT family N-acetyltransferase [soil metagenome]